VPVPTLARGVSALSTVGSVPVVTVRLIGPAGPDQGAISVAVFNPARTQLFCTPVACNRSGWVMELRTPSQPTGTYGAACCFNGGFKIADARGGWVSEGRTVASLVPGAASVVIYADGVQISDRGASRSPPHTARSFQSGRTCSCSSTGVFPNTW